jgi:FMN phosphatase YigB (HAD superfamily)
MKLIFDFDHTLFSAKKLYFALKKAFKKIGVKEDLFQEAFEKSKGKTRGRVYKPTRQIEFIVRVRPEINLKKLKRTLKKVLKESPNFLYPNTIYFLKKWRRKADLILLSYGEEKFQEQKIKSSKIKKYFKKIIITRDIEKSKPFKKLFPKNKKIIFVEDNPQALSKVKKMFKNVVTVRINRGEGKYTRQPDNSKIDFSIKNLKELEKVLNKIDKGS